jgi:hypothetical protein
VSDEASYRVSDDERERAIVALREHLLKGRLTLEEFSERADLALRAVIGRDLDHLRSDLPPGTLPNASRRRRTRITGGLFAHVVRRGRLRLGGRTIAISILSDIDLDLREASIESPRTSVIVLALVGNVDVYVPEGIDVDVGGVAVIGHRRDWGRDASMPDAPTLHVTVLGLLGTVDVWRVPRDVAGDYGSIVDKVRDVHRAAELPERGASTD